MTCSNQLFDDFRRALNAELTDLGCRLHVADRAPEAAQTMLLVSGDGRELGWVPDHADAPLIAAFERILSKVDHPYARA